MKKFIIFMILAIIGTGFFILASLMDSLYCSHADNSCSLVSKVKFLNYTISEIQFKPNDIKYAYCERANQPSAGGKRTYFLLKIKMKDNTDYSIGSYNKQKLCEAYADKVKDFKSHKTEHLKYNPAFGFLNLMVAIFGFLMFFIGIQVLKAKPEEEDDDFDDEEDDDTEETEQNTNGQKS